MNKATYTQLLKEIRRELKVLGVKSSIKRYPIHYPNKFGVSGKYSTIKKQVYVDVYGNQSRLTILAVLLHELRHAYHVNLNLFPGYYEHQTVNNKDHIQGIRDGKYEIPSLDEALSAENDCNRFAVEWLKSKNIVLDPNKKSYSSFFTPYPKWDIWFYFLKLELERVKERKLDSQHLVAACA
jgi:hypothetical protein